MDEGARRWLANAVRKHHWRVSRWYDLDDLIQEGYFAYYYTVRHYPKVTHPPHRMALFKLVFNSVICNLANQRTRRIDDICESSMVSGDEFLTPFLETVAADPDIAEAAAMLATAPKYVRDAVALFESKDGLKQLRQKYRKKVGQDKRGRFVAQGRETLNERLCRLTGYDPAQTDIVGGIRACLSGD